HDRQGLHLRCFRIAAGVPNRELHRAGRGADGHLIYLSSRLAEADAAYAGRFEEISMIATSRLIAIILLAGSSISYFKYERPVQLSGSGQQYVTIDEAIWQHARADLGDLRRYAGSTEVPYSLVTEQGTLEQERKDVPVLQQSTVAGKTQFLVDMSGL